MFVIELVCQLFVAKDILWHICCATTVRRTARVKQRRVARKHTNVQTYMYVCVQGATVARLNAVLTRANNTNINTITITTTTSR